MFGQAENQVLLFPAASRIRFSNSFSSSLLLHRLEGILNSNPKVAVSAVIGIYLESRGTEVPRAYIQLAPGVKDSKDALTKELSDYLAERVSQAKKLRGGVRFLDVVPISPSGKVLRKEMRALVERERESKL